MAHESARAHRLANLRDLGTLTGTQSAARVGGAAEPGPQELARDALYGRDRGDPFQSGDLGERPTRVCGGPAKTVTLTACMRTLLIILNAMRKHRTRWDHITSQAGAVREGRRQPPGGDPAMDGLAVNPTPSQ
jgi:hypothetical protein